MQVAVPASALKPDKDGKGKRLGNLYMDEFGEWHPPLARSYACQCFWFRV